jgi:hypothetical protein
MESGQPTRVRRVAPWAHFAARDCPAPDPCRTIIGAERARDGRLGSRWTRWEVHECMLACGRRCPSDTRSSTRPARSSSPVLPHQPAPSDSLIPRRACSELRAVRMAAFAKRRATRSASFVGSALLLRAGDLLKRKQAARAPVGDLAEACQRAGGDSPFPRTERPRFEASARPGLPQPPNLATRSPHHAYCTIGVRLWLGCVKCRKRS